MIQLRVYRNEKTIDQWNFKGRMIGSDNPFYCDINGDGLKEIFLFNYKDGGIFLNVFNAITKDTLIIDRFISEYKPISSRTDCGIHLCGFFDTNNDGIKEVFFSISTSFSIYPRIMIVYEPMSDKIIMSKNGCSIIENPVAYDLNNDGKLEFFGKSAAVGNCNTSSKFSDHFSWLMVFDNKMNFLFEPVQVGYYTSLLYTKPFTIGNKKNIIAFNLYEGDKDYESYFALFNQYGEMIKKKLIVQAVDLKSANLFQHTNDFQNVYLIKSNGEIERIDENLNLIQVSKNIALNNSTAFSLDVDLDDENEVIIYPNGFEQLIITRNDFSNPVTLNIPGSKQIQSHSLILNGEKQPTLYVESRDYGYHFNYYKNPRYFLKYFIYMGIYVVIILFIWMIQKTQRYRVAQKFEAEKQMASLQLKAIKNQVDPHFTLNVINSIGSLIYKKDKDKADYVFAKYSKLLRSTLLNSERIVTTLAEELEYAKTFLDLEKFRYGDKFIYEIKIDENINQSMKIPRMLIHTFVENAIKHGIKHLDADGKIEILAHKNGEITTIKIVDNGIGRAKAKELTEFSTGKGLRIIDQIIEMYYKWEGEKIAYEIIDRNGQGTEIIITVSYE
ncbi:MAG TPA: hypothetical protein ENN33_15990 [Ignavibacteria bacterium]|nr:hypothetical protein [Ignavibacteria bacterium]